MIEMKIELRQVSLSTSEASLRSHHVLIDRPQEKGGADRGPMGGALLSLDRRLLHEQPARRNQCPEG